MPEEISFARKASGLTRGLSTYDAMGIGLMVVQPIAGIWGMLYIGAGLYPGGNMIIAIVISIFACGITSALVWGMLGGSMPLKVWEHASTCVRTHQPDHRHRGERGAVHRGDGMEFFHRHL